MRAVRYRQIFLGVLLAAATAPVRHALAGVPWGVASEQIRIRGRVVDTVDGERLGDASLRIGGSARTRSRPNGAYQLKFTDELGVYAVKVRRASYWTRQSFFDVDRAALRRVEVDLLPKAKDFDMGFFDFVFRREGQAGTIRWIETPVFELIANTFVCQAGVAPGGVEVPCLTLVFKADPAPDFFLETMPRVIREGVPLLSGAALHDPVVRTRTIPTGQVLGVNDLQVPGVVTVVFGGTPRPTFASTTSFWDATSSMVSSLIMYGTASFNEALGYHELAHSVGFSHPGGQGAVPGGREISVMNFADAPTEPDRLHGAVLYRRPPGSRHPDRDPDTAALQRTLAEGVLLPRDLRLHSSRSECSGVEGADPEAAHP
jgi:hypothetical protein